MADAVAGAAEDVDRVIYVTVARAADDAEAAIERVGISQGIVVRRVQAPPGGPGTSSGRPPASRP
jgi:hypothetical protein